MAATIRNARESDLPRVGQLAGQLVRMHHAWDPLRWMMPDGVEAGYARFFGSQLDHPDTIILVAEDAQGEVVAYLYAALEPRSWADLREACGKLHDVFVAEHARRRGIASALTREAIGALARSRRAARGPDLGLAEPRGARPACARSVFAKPCWKWQGAVANRETTPAGPAPKHRCKPLTTAPPRHGRVAAARVS